jgi:type II secretory pathway predicted ATPase ExeA
VSPPPWAAHFGLSRTPFGKSIAARDLFGRQAHAEAIARISFCIVESALGVVMGDVGAGKTVALRATVDALDPTRHQVIYIANPAFGTRGLYVSVVRALGGRPRYLKAELMAQASDLLAAEAAERHRRVTVILDEAHLAAPDQLEELRLMLLCRDRDYAGGRQECPGDRVHACLTGGIIPGPRGTRGACRAAGTCPSSLSAARCGPGPFP